MDPRNDDPPGATPSPADAERRRLEALRRYALLDTPDEAEFDDITQLAANLCATPIALISLVDGHRQWFKSRVGLSIAETPRAVSFCAHAIQGCALFEIGDARLDPRFRDNPMVTGSAGVRFYAGTPLTTPDGYNLGTLCVVDHTPRALSAAQRDALARLGRQVVRLFEQRLLTRQYAEEAALHRVMEQRLQEIATQVPGMLFQYRWHPDEAGRFTYVSEGSEQIYGLSPAQLQDMRPIFERVHEADRHPMIAEIRQAIQAGRPWRVEHRAWHPRKGLIWLDGHAAPLPQGDGSVLWHGLVTDISERRQVRQLEQDFVSTVSHELRTPLTSITGSLSLLCNGVMGPIPSDQQELLDIAQQNSQRLAALVDDLLDLDKLDAGKMRIESKVQPLQPLLEQALSANRSYAERLGVQLSLLGQSEAQVSVDALRLHQVLSNLLSNAAKFSPRGGRVTLAAGRLDGEVRVSVSDRGPGIPEAFRPRVFQRFAQANGNDARQQGGTGLGLAISRALIERMGGRIGFDCPDGGGTCFWFELPLADEAPR